MKHRSIVDLQQTLKYVSFTKIQRSFKRWTLYEDRIADLSKRLKDERRGHTNHHVSKRLKARQMCVDTNAISKKPLLSIAQDTQQKLGVAFSYLESNDWTLTHI